MTPPVPSDEGSEVNRADTAYLRRLVRALVADLRANEALDPSSAITRPLADLMADLMADLGGGHVGDTVGDTVANDYIYSHDGDGSDTPFLSIVLLSAHDSTRILNDALVALDAQSDDDFEVIVVTAATHAPGLAKIEALLRRFSAGLASRTRIVVAPDAPSDVTPRLNAARIGAALARGRYVSFLSSTDLVFGHYVATFSHLARTSPTGVLRARAARQPLRLVAWRDGEPGYEPAAGAAAASSTHFSVLDHLVAPATPPGSYALRRDFVADLGSGLDEDGALVEAALLVGVHEASDDVVALLRTFEH